MRINLSKKILSIRGKPIETEEPTPGVSNAIMREITNFPVTTADALLKKFKEWQEKLQKTEKKDMLVRDYFLTILGQRFEIKERKENFWATELGILFSNEKNKVITVGKEISEKQVDFLKRIIEDNKVKQQTPMGIKEIELYFPYELGQLLKVLEGENGEAKEPEKSKKDKD